MTTEIISKNKYKDKLWYLSKNDIFNGLSPKDLKDVVHLTNVYNSNLNKIIYLPGDISNNVYFLKEGKVKLSFISEDGKKFTYAILDKGSIFGEICLTGLVEQTTIAEFIEDSYLCYISKSNFKLLLDKYPNLSNKINVQIGSKLTLIENKIKDIVFLDATTRLNKLLLDFCNRFSVETSEGDFEITLNLTHEEIGELISLNRKAVTEKLNELESLRIIDKKRKKIIIKDKKFLERLIS